MTFFESLLEVCGVWDGWKGGGVWVRGFWLRGV